MLRKLILFFVISNFVGPIKGTEIHPIVFKTMSDTLQYGLGALIQHKVMETTTLKALHYAYKKEWIKNPHYYNFTKKYFFYRSHALLIMTLIFYVIPYAKTAPFNLSKNFYQGLIAFPEKILFQALHQLITKTKAD